MCLPQPATAATAAPPPVVASHHRHRTWAVSTPPPPADASHYHLCHNHRPTDRRRRLCLRHRYPIDTTCTTAIHRTTTPPCLPLHAVPAIFILWFLFTLSSNA